MTVSMSWFQTIFEKVRREDQVENHLSEIKLALAGLNKQPLSQLASSLPLEVIFDCLNSSSSKQIHLSCDILQTLLPQVSPSSLVVDKYGSSLARSLTHPVKEVKEMTLKEFIRIAEDPNLLNLVRSNKSVLENIAKCLCDEELSVGNSALKFCVIFGQTPSGLAALCEPYVVKNFIESTGSNETYALRLYEVLIEISTSSPLALKTLNNHGFLDGLVGMLRSDDVLAMMVTIEEIIQLAVTQHGFEFLCKKDIVKCLVEQISSSIDDSLISLTFPGLSRFFGKVGSRFPNELTSKYPEALRTIFKAVSNDDMNISMCACEAYAYIASTTEGKLMLCRTEEEQLPSVMQRLHKCSVDAPVELKVRGLNALENILRVESDRMNELAPISQRWFDYMPGDGIDMIMGHASQPFKDLRFPALQVLEVLVEQPWALNRICSVADYMESLLNRMTEDSLEGLQIKYNVISLMCTHGEAIIPEHIYNKVVAYVKSGPCAPPPVPQVALEGGV